MKNSALCSVLEQKARRLFTFPHTIDVELAENPNGYLVTVRRLRVEDGRRKFVAGCRRELTWRDFESPSEALDRITDFLSSIRLVLDPPPLPIFRIGLRSPKRLQLILRNRPDA